MKRPQWIAAGAALLLTFGLFAATSTRMFGTTTARPATAGGQASSSLLSIDSLVMHAATHLSPEQATRLAFLQNSISRGDVKEQRLHQYHEMARFWRDTVRAIEPGEWFLPYAWYTAEAARLENSEKSLTFAAHLLLSNLAQEAEPRSKQWQAVQAKDLFERSLKLNPANDSSRIGLGSTMLYGGLEQPMQAIARIREVAEKDSSNVYAQMTLGEASLMSMQLEKALQRFTTVARQYPQNAEAVFRAAETSEQMGKTAEAVEWYRKLLPLINNAAIRSEVEARIAKLKK